MASAEHPRGYGPDQPTGFDRARGSLQPFSKPERMAGILSLDLDTKRLRAAILIIKC